MIPVQSPAVAHLLASPIPAAWIVIDIETADAPEDAIQAAIDAWTPPANVRDPAKIADRRAEAEGRIRERAALLDAAPIICIAVRDAPTNARIFHAMGALNICLPGWAVDGYNNEAEMLQALQRYLDARVGPETILVGHNLRSFDLPKLRARYVHHRLPLPHCLRVVGRTDDGQPTADTMSLFRAYSVEHRDDYAVSLDTVAAAFGVPRPKEHVSGADVPRLYREGHYAEIVTYAAIDADVTAEIYRLMTL